LHAPLVTMLNLRAVQSAVHVLPVKQRVVQLTLTVNLVPRDSTPANKALPSVYCVRWEHMLTLQGQSSASFVRTVSTRRQDSQSVSSVRWGQSPIKTVLSVNLTTLP